MHTYTQYIDAYIVFVVVRGFDFFLVLMLFVVFLFVCLSLQVIILYDNDLSSDQGICVNVRTQTSQWNKLELYYTFRSIPILHLRYASSKTLCPIRSGSLETHGV